MKHYALSYFPQTLDSFVKKYVAKYGENTDMYNKHGERNAHVILSRQGINPFARVQPWDMLMIVGHGVSDGVAPQAKQLGSDDLPVARDRFGQLIKGQEPSQGWRRDIEVNKQGQQVNALYASVNDVANWLDGKLNKDHVLLKLVMCVGGGGWGPRVSDDNFARHLANILYDRGYKRIAVGGYRGNVETGIKFYTSTPHIHSPNPNEVVSESGSRALGKDNLDYYHGSKNDLISKNAITIVKRLFRKYGCPETTPEEIQEITDIFKSGAVQQAAGGAGASYDFVKQAIALLVQAKRSWREAQPKTVVTTPTKTTAPPRPKSPLPGRARITHNVNDFPRWQRAK